MTVNPDLETWCRELIHFPRSLSGEGVRNTIAWIQSKINTVKHHTIKTGETVFDWEVPNEWNVKSATLTGPDGKTICDWSRNPLELVGYSIPQSGVFDLEDIQSHLFSLPDQPEAIPYITSYYKERWGFCLPHNVKESLPKGQYTVHINTTLEPGILEYADVIVKGKSEKEIFFSTYICHPNMANNEMSGIVVATALAKWAQEQNLKWTYRFMFVPETIGSLIYLSNNLNTMQERSIAGYILTCVGDERAWGLVPSRKGDTSADRLAQAQLENDGISYQKWKWTDRGSDERQLGSAGVDLPVASVTRSKYGTYPEYHTSLDTLGDVVTEKGLQETLEFYKRLITRIEEEAFPKARHLGEPQLGKRNLYPSLSKTGSGLKVRPMLDVLSYCDGKTELSEIARLCEQDIETARNNLQTLIDNDLVF